MDINFQKIKAAADPDNATSGTYMEDAFNGNFDKIKANFTEQQQAIVELSYKSLTIDSFTGGEIYERGRVISEINFAWTFNKAVTSQSIVPDVPALSVDAHNYKLTGQNITTDRTYTLSATDGKTPRNRTTQLLFRDSCYWGVSEKTTLTNAEILALLSGELGTNWMQARTFNCSGGKFFYIIGPSAWGTPSFRVGGLAFSAMEKTNIAAFTNASGAILSVDIWRVRDIQTGSNINVEVL